MSEQDFILRHRSFDIFYKVNLMCEERKSQRITKVIGANHLSIMNVCTTHWTIHPAGVTIYPQISEHFDQLVAEREESGDNGGL